MLNDNDIKRTTFFIAETKEFSDRYMEDFEILAVNKTKNEIFYLKAT